MSLIHDALRKARRESNEDTNRGVVYARGLTGRSGRPGVGRGILLGALLAIVVGGIVGGALWLRLEDRPAQVIASARTASPVATSESRSAAVDRQPSTIASPAVAIAAEDSSPREAQDDDGEVPGLAPTAKTTSHPEPVATERSSPNDQPQEHRATSGPNPIPTRAPPTPVTAASDSAERVYEVEADLGYATLTLDYIVFRPTDPFAQINGVDVRVGGTIDGFTLEEIGRTSVRLRDGRGAVVLRVP